MSCGWPRAVMVDRTAVAPSQRPVWATRTGAYGSPPATLHDLAGAFPLALLGGKDALTRSAVPHLVALLGDEVSAVREASAAVLCACVATLLRAAQGPAVWRNTSRACSRSPCPGLHARVSVQRAREARARQQTAGALAPVYCELAVELSFPVPEGTSAGLLTFVCNLSTFAVLFVAPLLPHPLAQRRRHSSARHLCGSHAVCQGALPPAHQWQHPPHQQRLH
eukprot:TRINITY_DN1255_c1_g2_i1.p1 TRINITY_DN1255_c1_g2~~TRINITY_DN1255_c1_g2_i1.p1  ORF type:complete len:223 (-),score=24.34 TRINITY_DN1255_c1_g2_i1:195-863(-)